MTQNINDYCKHEILRRLYLFTDRNLPHFKISVNNYSKKQLISFIEKRNYDIVNVIFNEHDLISTLEWHREHYEHPIFMALCSAKFAMDHHFSPTTKTTYEDIFNRMCDIYKVTILGNDEYLLK